MNWMRPWVLVSVVVSSVSFADIQSPLAVPPGNLAPVEVPQFVMLGFDDNPDPEAMEWMLRLLAPLTNPAGSGQTATFDAAPVRAAFYSNSRYLVDDPRLVTLHQVAFDAGHEMGNHTHSHDNGAEFTVTQWQEEIEMCTRIYSENGISAAEIRGFRAPFLAHNAAALDALDSLGFTYDTSLEEGYQPGQDGRNFLWPYTLDEGSPGNALLARQGGKPAIESQAGLWEIPLHAFMVPPDDACEEYGVAPGLRQRIHEYIRREGGWEWDVAAGKITGLDWNVLEMAGRDGAEFLAILKYSLDLRLDGNRAPFMLGGHTAMYPAGQSGRREAMREFLAYALGKPEVRIVTPRNLLTWMRDPVALAAE